MVQRLILNRWEIFFPSSPPPPFQEIFSAALAGYMRLGDPRAFFPSCPSREPVFPPAATGAHGVSGCDHSFHGISLPARQDCLHCKVPTWGTGRKQTHFPTTMGMMFSWFKKYFVQGGRKQAGRTFTFRTWLGHRPAGGLSATLRPSLDPSIPSKEKEAFLPGFPEAIGG